MSLSQLESEQKDNSEIRSEPKTYRFWEETESFIDFPDGKIQYLKDIDFKDYRTLGQIHALSGYDHLAFKYSEEDFPDEISFQYFFPALNMAFPYLAGQYYLSSNPIFSNNYYEILGSAFDDNSTFIIDLQGGDILSTCEEIDIGFKNNTNEDLIAFEDYLSATRHYDETNVKYCDEDPKLYKYIQFFGSNVTSDEIDISDDIILRKNISELESKLNELNLSCMYSEESVNDENRINDKTSFSPIKSDIAQDFSKLDKFLKLYITYQKDKDGRITLMVNQSNFISTPFIKIDQNGRVYPDVIPSTYATIRNGDTGYVDVIVQFKYYRWTELIGYNNIKFATYQIINISDDKPKFILNRVGQLENGDGKISNDKFMKIVCDRYIGIEPDEFSYNVSLQSNIKLESPVTATLIYQGSLFEYTGDDKQVIKNSDGWLTITFTDIFRSISLKFKPILSESGHFPERRKNKTNSVIIKDVNNTNGENIVVNVKNGSMTIV